MGPLMEESGLMADFHQLLIVKESEHRIENNWLGSGISQRGLGVLVDQRESAM